MRILVTGAARAIGRATVIECARRGHEVVATARDPRLLDDLDVSKRLELDVTDPESIARALAGAGELDGVVSNAALTGRGRSKTSRSSACTRSSIRTPTAPSASRSR